MDGKRRIRVLRATAPSRGSQSVARTRLSINPVLVSGRDVRSAVVPSSRSSPRLQGANVDLGEFLSLPDLAEV